MKYTKILRCPNECSSSAQARFYPAQNEMQAFISCGNCGAQWLETSADVSSLVKQFFVHDVPKEIIDLQ
ncbi:hypothetical protein [Vibrio parahaemolyticus]|uniref:hypothetical protein n=1 Tax=Vibrio parahaemolyticus TaxID=670 RepID=UPI00046F1D5F|nr:hypothetical protein [Vibrio parahaemolyticus]TBT52485.1 hypothetical protein D5E76_24995 [Vibrio parahaemolyticus]TOK02410.1 hypothetical protein CGI26_23295 [Vibrio parahaemolyticus]HCM0974863.1 hypothetical protein [Vibrio parahaemolyticus]